MKEFSLIRLLTASGGLTPGAWSEGIGDDCAVLPLGAASERGGGEEEDEEVLLFTTDLLCEGVHFLRHAATPEEIASKALHVNLSDVAAMGGRPEATLLSAALPDDAFAGDWGSRFFEGYAAASRQAGVGLVGGDTSRSQGGIVINVTAIGRARRGHVKLRSMARPGDAILVTGELGGSGAGLQELLAGRYDTPLARRHKLPEARMKEGLWLGGRPEVHAMMDLSDGLASDLRRIMERSGVGAEVAVERIPAAPGADVRTAACGGEDYELLLTADGAAAEALCRDFQAAFGKPLHVVGRITEATDGEPVWTVGGRPAALGWQGFEHAPEKARK